jgi:hypothetical protein
MSPPPGKLVQSSETTGDEARDGQPSAPRELARERRAGCEQHAGSDGLELNDGPQRRSAARNVVIAAAELGQVLPW